MVNEIGEGWATMALGEIGSGWRFLFGVCGWWSSWGLAFTMKVGMVGSLKCIDVTYSHEACDLTFARNAYSGFEKILILFWV